MTARAAESAKGTSPMPFHGCGLRFQHLPEWLATDASPCLLEVHTENLFALSPAARERLLQLRTRHAFSLHGVGMSLGSADGLDVTHLRKVAEQVRCYEPDLVSEHLAWNRVNGVSVPDLLPLPYDNVTLGVVADNVDLVQNRLGRTIAIENISVYLQSPSSDHTESAFLTELARRTGCTLLVDLNNLYVNQLNHGDDAWSAIQELPALSISQWHLGGPTEVHGAWIDTHANTVPEAVWALYERALALVGPRPTVVEWDQDLPPLSTLLALAEKARSLIQPHRHISERQTETTA